MLQSEICAEDLQKKLTDRRLVLLFTSMTDAPATKPELIIRSGRVYIPNSLCFDFQNTVVDRQSALSNMMPSSTAFEEHARKLGLNNDSNIVVYDDFGNFCASRVWFMFKAMGHKHVQTLRGGLVAWLNYSKIQDVPLSSALRKKASNLGNFIARPNDKYRFVDRETVRKCAHHQLSARGSVIDARSEARFRGLEIESKPNLRSGHIPNSYNIHYRSVQDEQGAFKPLNELRDIFKAKLHGNVSPLVFSCGSGVTACILAQAADALAYSPLYVYDGSWSDWGSDHSLPIELGE